MNKIISSTDPTYGPVQRGHWLHNRVVNIFIDLTVQIMYWTFKIGLLPMRRSRYIAIKSRDIQAGFSYVIAANHQSVLDPFVITSQLPLAVWLRLRNLRSFLINYIFDNRLLRPLAISIGSFPARSHPQYPFGLDFAISQLNRGRAVLIFPEGRRTIHGDFPIKRGIHVLAQQPKVMIIPVHIEWKLEGFGRSFASGIGRPFEATTLTPEEIMDRVYAVPVT